MKTLRQMRHKLRKNHLTIDDLAAQAHWDRNVKPTRGSSKTIAAAVNRFLDDNPIFSATPTVGEPKDEYGDLGQHDRSFAGFHVRVENPAGSTRSGTDSDGKSWSVEMKHDYGFLKGQKGADGEGVDVFLGPWESSPNVYIVHQVDPASGKHDEDKIMLGWDDVDAAKRAYLSNYDRTDTLGSITEVPIDTFREAVKNKGGAFKWKQPMTGVAFAAEDDIRDAARANVEVPKMTPAQRQLAWGTIMKHYEESTPPAKTLFGKGHLIGHPLLSRPDIPEEKRLDSFMRDLRIGHIGGFHQRLTSRARLVDKLKAHGIEFSANPFLANFDSTLTRPEQLPKAGRHRRFRLTQEIGSNLVPESKNASSLHAGLLRRQPEYQGKNFHDIHREHLHNIREPLGRIITAVAAHAGFRHVPDHHEMKIGRGTFEGVLAENLRVPLPQGLSDEHIKHILVGAGHGVMQAAQAASHYRLRKPGEGAESFKPNEYLVNAAVLRGHRASNRELSDLANHFKTLYPNRSMNIEDSDDGKNTIIYHTPDFGNDKEAREYKPDPVTGNQHPAFHTGHLKKFSSSLREHFPHARAITPFFAVFRSHYYEGPYKDAVTTAAKDLSNVPTNQPVPAAGQPSPPTGSPTGGTHGGHNRGTPVAGGARIGAAYHQSIRDLAAESGRFAKHIHGWVKHGPYYAADIFSANSGVQPVKSNPFLDDVEVVASFMFDYGMPLGPHQRGQRYSESSGKLSDPPDTGESIRQEARKEGRKRITGEQLKLPMARIGEPMKHHTEGRVILYRDEYPLHTTDFPASKPQGQEYKRPATSAYSDPIKKIWHRQHIGRALEAGRVPLSPKAYEGREAGGSGVVTGERPHLSGGITPKTPAASSLSAHWENNNHSPDEVVEDNTEPWTQEPTDDEFIPRERLGTTKNYMDIGHREPATIWHYDRGKLRMLDVGSFDDDHTTHSDTGLDIVGPNQWKGRYGHHTNQTSVVHGWGYGETRGMPKHLRKMLRKHLGPGFEDFHFFDADTGSVNYSANPFLSAPPRRLSFNIAH